MPPYISWPAGFVIAPAKVTRYLLDPAGSSPAKARWWLAQGFSAQLPNVLCDALFDHTSLPHFAGITMSRWGHRLIFEGPIRTPVGTMPRVRSVWQVGYGTPAGQIGQAILVTAHRI